MSRSLARKSMTAGGLRFFAISASAPMTVLVGGIVQAFAATGVVGVPLAFLLLTAALWVLTVAYVAMVRYVPHAAPFYALLARGLGRPWGVAGGFVALLAYNAVEIALFGLVGATLAPLVHGPWWACAGTAWVAVGVCGVLRVDISGAVVRFLLVGEMAVIVIFDIASFAHPAGGHISLTPLRFDHLAVNGVGGVLALCVASFLGWESAPAYAEEARTDQAAGRATISALLLLGPFYAVSAWAVTIAVGPAQVATAAQADPDLPFTLLRQMLGVFGPLAAGIGRIFLVTSIFAAVLSFHGTVARYTFALARGSVLWGRLAHTGAGGSSRRDAPVGGSVLQSCLAALVIAVFALAKVNPLTGLFTWLAALAAVAVLVLLTAVSGAAIRFFKKGGGGGTQQLSKWSSSWAPWLGLLAGGGSAGVAVWNLSTLLGGADGPARAFVIPAVIVAAVEIGLVRAGRLRRTNPDAYDKIGRDRSHDLAVPDQRLNDVLRTDMLSDRSRTWAR